MGWSHNKNNQLTGYDSNAFTYDNNGNMIQQTVEGVTRNYFYDIENRLTRIEEGGITGMYNRKSYPDGDIISSYIYSLDPSGNRMKITQNEPLEPTMSASNTIYSYNAKRNRLQSAGSSNFGYDLEGQLSSKDSTVYSFDYAHRLKNVGGTDQYFYNGSGLRLKAIRNGVTTYYIYDPAGNLLAEADGNKTITRYYIYGAGLLATVTANDAVYCYHFNGTGSTVAMTDSGKNIVNKYAYTPFAKISGEDETIAQPFKFVGQFGVMAESNGLYYMRARYYDPEVGRFISQDPIGFAGGDVNLYGYVGNNPINLLDPDGYSARSVFLGGVSYAVNTAALTTIWEPETASAIKVIGTATSIATIANAYYEYKLAPKDERITRNQFVIAVGAEAVNYFGASISNKIAKIIVNSKLRSFGAAMLGYDIAETITKQKSKGCK